jgi:hypothetical protein
MASKTKAATPRKQSKASLALEAAAVAYAAAHKAWRDAEKPFHGVIGSALTPEYEAQVTPLRRAKDDAEMHIRRLGGRL